MSTQAVVIAAPASGSGKTTVATGLIGALRRAGRKVAPFKVGPDFIDPGYHALAAQRPGRNLDPVLVGERLIGPLYRHGSAGADIAVVEGVMGLFDGRITDDFAGTAQGSTAEVAALLGAPVILVVDAAAIPPWQRCGVLQLADGGENEARVADTAVALAYPVDYALHATRADASALAGCRAAIGGWWFPMAGFVRPAAIVDAQLGRAARSVRGPAPVLHLDRHVASLQREGDGWTARDASGAKIAAAPVVVLANACDAARLVDLGAAPLRRIRGQQSYLRAPPFAAPRVVVGGDGYVLPAVDGIAVAGATYDLDDDDRYPNAVSHAVNLARAEHMLPGSAAGIDAATLDGGVGFRCVVADRLPMVGAIVDIDRARADQAALAGAHLADLPRVRGLYGAFAFASRGLSWSALAAEALASELDAEPAPLSHALLDAIDPGRFAVKSLRRGAL